MNKKENKIFVIAIISLIFLLFMALIGSKVFQKQLSEMKNLKTRHVSSIDWEELYPYDTQITLVDSEVMRKSVPLSDKIIRKVKKFSSLGNNWARLIYGYDDLAKTGYIITSRLTDPSVGNQYIRLKNGYWIAASVESEFDEGRDVIEAYASLQRYLDNKGIKFLYFYTPSKDCDVDDEYPDGIHSFVNKNIDQKIGLMNYYGVNCVDLRKNLHNEGLNHYAMFYKTDHHWTVFAGLWAASEIVNEINGRLGIKMINPLEVGEYQPIVYTDAEFGSYGNGLTHYVANSEDFVIYYPKFKTNYRLEVPNKEIDVNGSFEDIFIDHEGLQEVQAQGGGAAYGKILYGNPPYEKITNYKNPHGPKILMIRDSFSIVVAPYLATSCSELVMLDTRPNNGYFTGSIISCINDFKPDVVLALQCAPQSIKLNKPK